MKWSTACPDWEERIVNRRSLVPIPPLFPEEAEAALRVFKSLPVVDLPGMPTFGEVARPWVFDFVGAIFGAQDPATGQRLITDFFELISKKNGKSTISAGIMITALIRNWRNNNELTIIAPTIEVAKNSADPALAMVQRKQELMEILRPVPHRRLIEHRTTKAELKILAADSETVSGSKAAFVLFEEWWLFGKMARAEDMEREATGGLASRPEGFVIKLSTQSDEPPAGVFKADLQRFRDIRDGKIIAPASLGVIYEFPEAMIESGAFALPENWYVTNPNIEASVRKEFLQQRFDEAKNKGKSALAGFYAKHLNVEIGTRLRSDRWAGADHWDKRAEGDITPETMLARCEVIIVGIDGGGLDDLFGLTLLGREPVEVEYEIEAADTDVFFGAAKDPAPRKEKRREKRWLSWSHAWCHKDVLTRRQSIASVLEGFAKDGDLTIVGDELADLSTIVEIVQRIKDAGLLYCVAVDPAGLGEIVDALAEIGVTQENRETKRNFLIGVSQGFALMNAIKTAERRVVRGSLLHAEQPLMDWCVGNLKIEATRTAILATKQNAGDAKVDPAFALFDAVTVMTTNPDPARSLYEERGLLVL